MNVRAFSCGPVPPPSARVKRIAAAFAFVALRVLILPSFAQQPGTAPSGNRPVAGQPEVVVVTGTVQPVPLSESDRPVMVIDAAEGQLLVNSVVDYLRSDSSVDVRQRGIDGIQADLSIQGSSFGQSLVLVNGMRVNDAQSGHHNMDVPLPMESLSRIEVLHGAGSTFHGADAVGGAVNFITTAPTSTEIRFRVGVGNFGFNQQHLSASLVSGRWSEVLAADRDFSTGFRADRDFRSSSVSSETRVKSLLGNTNLLLATSDRPFGADQFYGNFNSWERTKGWVAFLGQELGPNTRIDFGYRRHSDEFVLFRDRPAVYENNHITRSWQVILRHVTRLGDNSTLSYGVEADGDEIESNNLGNHARNRGAGYVNLDLRALHRFSLSLGAREEVFSGGRAEFVPSLAGGVWLKNAVKLRASISRGFRLPTYTDLYYHDPASIGNPLLKPESAWSVAGGPEFNPGGRVSATATAFYRRDSNGIDYVKQASDAPWQATNIQNLTFTGAEAAVRLHLRSGQQFNIAYTALEGTKAVPNLISRYVFNYATHNASVDWLGQFNNAVGLRTRVGVLQRVGRDPYALWDAAVCRLNGRIRPYLQLSNLTNTRYQEIPGVDLPGTSFVAGAEFVTRGKSH